ncbi:MAG: hypothetical protein ACI9DJ_003158 [Algoriphagus sp.]|jgi:hypothetical protein
MRHALYLFFIFSLSASAQVPALEVLSDSLRNTEKDTTKKFQTTIAQVFGMKHYKSSEKPKVAFVRSLFLPGWGQITNGQYLKTGIVYAAAGAGWYFGVSVNNRKYKQFLGHYERTVLLSRNLVFSDESLTATISPSGASYYLSDNGTNETFYLVDAESNQYILSKVVVSPDGRDDYFIAGSSSEQAIIGPFSAGTFESAKDQYRRWRDASVIGFAAGWLFFALEANVSAHLKTFDMSDDISFKIAPAGPETFGFHASGIKMTMAFK